MHNNGGNYQSPSHAVGLERERVSPSQLEEVVSIPHGGLGTHKGPDFFKKMCYKSPSHIVGLKHLPKSLKIKIYTLSKLKQPTGRAH